MMIVLLYEPVECSDETISPIISSVCVIMPARVALVSPLSHTSAEQLRWAYICAYLGSTCSGLCTSWNAA